MQQLLESVGAVAVAHRIRGDERETLYQIGERFFIHWMQLADDVEYLAPQSPEAVAAWLAGQVPCGAAA